MAYGMNQPYNPFQQGSYNNYSGNAQMVPQYQQAQHVSSGAAASYGYGQGQNSYGVPPQTSQMSVDWIQGGVNSAKAYPKPAPGCATLLMDSDLNMFFIKKTDPSGFPLPLRMFTYREESMQQNDGASERQSTSPDMSQYMRKEDFKAMLEEYLGPTSKETKK